MEEKNEGTKSAPDAIVIGAMRAGTTALYRSLQASGLVAVPEAKETDYYLSAEHLARGERWYRNQFRNSPLPWIDICPNYTKRDLFPNTANRIREGAPHAKLIFIARDPVTRAVSQYNHAFMHRAGLPEPSALIGTRQGDHILKVSRYAYQLEPYFALWPKEDILIVDFDELLKTPDRTLLRIAGHIGLDQDAAAISLGELQNANSGVDVRRMPRWWGWFRDTPAGQYLKARSPRRLIDLTRSVLKTDKVVEVPKFDPATLAGLAEQLKADADLFRKMTGRRFANWQV